MEREITYRIRPGYALRQFLDEYLAIPVGPAEKRDVGVAVLNPMGHYLWDKLQTAQTREDLLTAILDEFDVDRETAMRDLDEFLNQLKIHEFLEEKEEEELL